jgi:hypothetical protein
MTTRDVHHFKAGGYDAWTITTERRYGPYWHNTASGKRWWTKVGEYELEARYASPGPHGHRGMNWRWSVRNVFSGDTAASGRSATRGVALRWALLMVPMAGWTP